MAASPQATRHWRTGTSTSRGPGFDQHVFTAPDGTYTINVPGGATYLVCEVFPNNTWAQTFPVAGPGVVGCNPPATQGPLGYLVNVNVAAPCCGGQPVVGKDFGNKLPADPLVECKEDPQPGRAPDPDSGYH